MSDNEVDIEARQIALQLVIHQGLSFEDAYKKAYQFILYEYDKDAHQIREMHQTCFVRYTVERHTNPYGQARAEVHIACTDISGFQVIVMRLKAKDLSTIPSLVEEQARKQIDELLYSSKQKAGRISVKEVNSFNGDF